MHTPVSQAFVKCVTGSLAPRLFEAPIPPLGLLLTFTGMPSLAVCWRLDYIHTHVRLGTEIVNSTPNPCIIAPCSGYHVETLFKQE